MIIDLEGELTANDVKEVTAESLNGEVGFFVRRILEELGELSTPQRLITHAIQSGGLVTATYQELNLGLLEGLSDQYFGKPVSLHNINFGPVPFSLERYEGRTYVKVHVSKEEFEGGNRRK